MQRTTSMLQDPRCVVLVESARLFQRLQARLRPWRRHGSTAMEDIEASSTLVQSRGRGLFVGSGIPFVLPAVRLYI